MTGNAPGCSQRRPPVGLVVVRRERPAAGRAGGAWGHHVDVRGVVRDAPWLGARRKRGAGRWRLAP